MELANIFTRVQISLHHLCQRDVYYFCGAAVYQGFRM